jgi:hypothetical protein
MSSLVCAAMIAGAFLGQAEAVQSSELQPPALVMAEQSETAAPAPIHPRVHGTPGRPVAAFWIILPRKQ